MRYFVLIAVIFKKKDIRTIRKRLLLDFLANVKLIFQIRRVDVGALRGNGRRAIIAYFYKVKLCVECS